MTVDSVHADARGERSIVVGRDAVQSILVTGDHNRVFVGEYEPLRDTYIQPWSVFQRVDVEGFIGREWLFAEIDRFLANEDCGYFVLEASAGLGKTALLAYLVQQRGYVHHFVETGRGPDGVAPALRSLAAQVIRAAELLPFSVDEVLPSTAGSRPDFLANLLKRASDRRVGNHDKLVIVVDGLDEAGVPIGHNVLGLPEVLPAGVYVVVSQRPVPVPLDVRCPLRVFSMDAGNDHNLGDMRRFLERAVASVPLATVVRDSAHTPAEVVERLVAHSAGVWIYLHYVLADMVRERHLDLDVLPDGLWAYYARFWRRWRAERRAEWYETYLPLLATLASVQEDVTAELLAPLAGTGGGPALAALLDEEWLPFLAVDEAGEERRYRLYHASVREFLEGRLDTTGRRAMDVALAREFERAVRTAHARIADRYLRRWGGLEHGLEQLFTDSAPFLDGGYGLRHLTAHLAGAGRHRDLERLLRLEVGARNVWFAAQDLTGELSTYQADVARAWRLAEKRGGRKAGGRGMPDVAAEVRCGLYTSSVNSLAGSIPPKLLVGLVRAGMWSPAKGLAYARQTLDQSVRASMLAGLAGVTPESLQVDLLGAVETLDRHDSVEKALAGMAQYLPDALIPRAVRALGGKRSGRDSAAKVVAIRLAVRLGRLGRCESAFQLLATYVDVHELPDAFAGLVVELPDDQLDVALRLAMTVTDPEARVRALTPLLPRLRDDLMSVARDAVLEAVTDLSARTLIDVLSVMPGCPSMTRRVIDSIGRWNASWARSRCLTALAAGVTDAQRTKILERSLAEARAIEITDRRPEQGLFERADAFGALLPLVIGEARAPVLAEATAAARAAFVVAVEEVVTQPYGWAIINERTCTGPLIRAEGFEKLWHGVAPVLLAGRLSAAEARELLGPVCDKVDGIPHVANRVTVLDSLLLPQAPLTFLDEVSARLVSHIDGLNAPKVRCDLYQCVFPRLTGPAKDRAAAGIADTLHHRGLLDHLATLNRLGPHLTPDLVAAALPNVAAWTPEFLPSAVKDIDALIPYLSSDHVEHLIQIARRVDDHPEQIAAAAALAPYLPDERRAAVVARALAVCDRRGEGRDSREEVLARLAVALAEQGHVDEAIDVAAALRHNTDRQYVDRCNVLTDLARLLAPSEPAAALRAVARIVRAGERRRALSIFLTRTLDLQAALALVRTMLGKELAPTEIAELTEARRWSRDSEPEKLPGELTDIPERTHGRQRTCYRPQLNRLRREDADGTVKGACAPTGSLDTAMDSALSKNYSWERARALTAVAEAVSALPPTAQLPAVRSVLARAPYLPRPDLLAAFTAFAPVIVQVGGRRAAEELADALEDVTRWWP